MSVEWAPTPTCSAEEAFGDLLARPMPADSIVKLCPRCCRPWGKGTLLDAVPVSPRIGANGVAQPQAMWENFARKYKCPSCAAYEEDNDEAVA